MHLNKVLRLAHLTWIIRFLYITSQVSTSFVFVVQQACTVKSLWTPVPSTVSNFCLQCLCTQQNFSLCRKVLVQLSPGCTVGTTVVGTLIDPRAGNATTAPIVTNGTAPINAPPTAGTAPTAATTVPILTPPPTAPPVIVPPPTPPPNPANIPTNPANPATATNSTVIAAPPGK